jgi:bifunctional DNA-binding transcriptional regulator/antitoxin component of YhaV-PrlF toxin-antitoxin module
LKNHFIAKIVAGHRITVPKEVCEVSGVKDGDIVDVDLEIIEMPQKFEKQTRGRGTKWK